MYHYYYALLSPGTPPARRRDESQARQIRYRLRRLQACACSLSVRNWRRSLRRDCCWGPPFGEVLRNTGGEGLSSSMSTKRQLQNNWGRKSFMRSSSTKAMQRSMSSRCTASKGTPLSRTWSTTINFTLRRAGQSWLQRTRWLYHCKAAHSRSRTLPHTRVMFCFVCPTLAILTQRRNDCLCSFFVFLKHVLISFFCVF